MKYLSPLLLVIGLLFSSVAHGQKGRDLRIEFRVTRFDPSDRPPPEFATAAGKSFKVPMHNISKPIKGVLRQGRYLDLVSVGKKKTVEISGAKKKGLVLVFVPNEDSYSIFPIHVSEKKLGGGSRLLLNATGASLAIKYGEQKPVVLEKYKQAIFKSKSKESMVPLLMSVKKKDKWKLVRSERWPNDPRFRSFVFVYTKSGSKRLHVHAIPDRL